MTYTLRLVYLFVCIHGRNAHIGLTQNNKAVGNCGKRSYNTACVHAKACSARQRKRYVRSDFFAYRAKSKFVKACFIQPVQYIQHSCTVGTSAGETCRHGNFFTDFNLYTPIGNTGVIKKGLGGFISNVFFVLRYTFVGGNYLNAVFACSVNTHGIITAYRLHYHK